MQITKTVQEIGNGAHIYMPKETIGKKVVITLKEKTINDIKEEIITILKPYLKHIQGIYLHGSYARNEQSIDSDIDILVITDGTKIAKKINEYEIMAMSEEQLEKSLAHTAPLILPAIKESIPILNKKLIEKYKKQKLTKKNTRWYIESTESSLAVSKEALKLQDKTIMPNIVYPLILRLKGLDMIKSLAEGRGYSNRIIANYLKYYLNNYKIKQLYKMYAEKRDKKPISSNSLELQDIKTLYEATEKYYNKVKVIWAKLK